MWLICFLAIFVVSRSGGTEQTNFVDEHEFLIVSLDGTTVEQFESIQSQFQEIISQLTIDFCNANGFQNYGTINASTIQVNKVQECPQDWPEAELCINVNFSVPINSSDRYELNSRHLRAMWRTHTYAQLKDLGVKEYEMPTDAAILILWLSVTGILCVLFLVILVLVVKTKVIENYIRRRRDILGSSNRSWLSKHGDKQLVPPFFEPESSITKFKEPQIHYNCETNIRKRSFGIENPAYDPEIIPTHKIERKLPQGATTIVDDFDSDDETIYPPPLTRPHQTRTEKTNVAASIDELETAF